MRTKSRNFLSQIPRACVVRSRLAEIQEEVRQLQILLEVAERLEEERQKSEEVARV